MSGAPNFDEKGNVIGSIGIHLDITEAKNNRALLEEQKMELDTIFSNVPIGYYFGEKRQIYQNKFERLMN